MKEGDYQTAMEKYTLALEHVQFSLNSDERYPVDLYQQGSGIH